MHFSEAGMRVLALCVGLALILSVEPCIAAQDAPADATRTAAAAIADGLVKQRATGGIAPDARDAAMAVPRTATMAIAPAPIIDPGAEMFIGTGDGSNGFWFRP